MKAKVLGNVAMKISQAHASHFHFHEERDMQNAHCVYTFVIQDGFGMQMIMNVLYISLLFLLVIMISAAVLVSASLSNLGNYAL